LDADVRAQLFLGRLGLDAPVALAALSAELRFLAVNEQMAAMNGVPADAHIGRTLRDVAPVVAEQIEPIIEKVFATGEHVLGVEVKGRHPTTGVMRWAEANYFPIVEDGETIAVGCAVLDTTDRINALRRLLLLQDAVGAIANAPEPLTAIQQIAARALDAVSAQGAAVILGSEDGEWLELFAIAGPLGDEILSKFPRIPTFIQAPATVAFKDRQTVWVATRAEWETQFPEGANMIALGARAALTVPLEVPRTGECMGVLGLLWDHEPALTSNDLALVATFAKQATESLDRIVLLDSERRARERFELLAELGTRVDEEITLDGRLRTFLDLVVPSFADFALVDVQLGEDEELPVVHARHIEPEREELLLRLRELRRHETSPTSLTGVIARGEPQLLEDVASGGADVEGEALWITEQLGVGSTALFPLAARGRVFGGVALGRRRERPAFTDADFALTTELARRLAVALENSRLYERERQIAETLQHSLLPDTVPDIPGLRCWPRYLPGTDLVVGGDFWDMLPLPAGRVLLTVGDVAGRGERAAITMGRLRTVLRASARQERSPAALMSALNRFLVDDEHEMATCVCAVLDPAERTLRIASAGHLPILRFATDGRGELVGGATGLPLGVRAFASYREDVFQVEPGDTLVLFTDGLVERRDASIDARLEQLLAVTSEAIAAGGDRWCDLVVDAMIEEQRSDDVALLGVRLASGPQTFFSRSRAELGQLRELRDQFRAWLAANRVDHETVDALCLAVGEATANVAMHAYGPTGGELRVHGTIDDGVVRVRVEDDGHWRPSPDDLGRGMRIIEQLCDTVQIERRDDGTTIEVARRMRPS
jgi:serine/threonine-protein kinase RsbW